MDRPGSYVRETFLEGIAGLHNERVVCLIHTVLNNRQGGGAHCQTHLPRFFGGKGGAKNDLTPWRGRVGCLELF